MQIDLNNPNEFTLENISKLIASKDDSKHRQLRVTKAGKAYISDDVGCDNLQDITFRFEIFCKGNDYFGERASKDTKLVTRIFDALKKNWPNPKYSFIDRF